MMLSILTACLIVGPAFARDSARFDTPMINESSGIVRSSMYPGVYWTHNDSGDGARIFPVTREGKLMVPPWYEGDYPGVEIADAVNIDWEDIALDAKGNLVIGAFGNNYNVRRDLCLYVVAEPNPANIAKARIQQKIMFRYPGQTEYPPPKSQWNYDAEALFCADDNYYILTKNRGDFHTNLYSFDTIDPNGVNELVLRETYDIHGFATAADLSPDGKLLAILTYDSIWLFERNGKEFLSGQAYRYRLKDGGQCEAICFDGEELLVTNEEGKLFWVPVAEVQKFPVKP